MLTGQNGILMQAQNAKKETEISEVIEKAKIDIAGVQAENNGELTEEQLNEILTSSSYATKGTLSDNGESSILDKVLTTQDGKYQISIREIYNGAFKEKEKITFTINGIQFEAEEGAKWGNWITENKQLLIDNNFEDLSELPTWSNYIGIYIGGGTCIPALKINGEFVSGYFKEENYIPVTEVEIINGGNYTWQ